MVEKKVKNMIDHLVTSTSMVQLVQHISSPLVFPDPDLEHFNNYEASGYDWQQSFTCKSLQEPLVSLGEEEHFTNPYNFDHSDKIDDEIHGKMAM